MDKKSEIEKAKAKRERWQWLHGAKIYRAPYDVKRAERKERLDDYYGTDIENQRY